MVIVLASFSGAPGVSTLALGMALNWREDITLIDADPHPSQAVLTGYLHGVDARGKGLVALANSYRDQGGLDAPHACIALTPPAPRRAYLPGFTHPNAAENFAPFWRTLFDQVSGDVIVDAGRLVAGRLAAGIAEAADDVIVTCGSRLPEIAACKLGLPTLRAQLDRDARLAVVGPNRPYGAREIAGELGLGLACEIPWEPDDAAALSEGTRPRRGFADRHLWRSFQEACEEVSHDGE